jgi:hypothetical protein
MVKKFRELSILDTEGIFEKFYCTHCFYIMIDTLLSIPLTSSDYIRRMDYRRSMKDAGISVFLYPVYEGESNLPKRYHYSAQIEPAEIGSKVCQNQKKRKQN